ncbi:DUF6412 domain-containing protein [Kitasatospora sp. LaBMicrA B282]|uniref:DUF6412 domain-containing protein n=1 Tax=Kitasatospora sp. LaBMicrA B282 TaxID=3420949 RepID=UPI003D147AA0
MLQLLTFVLGVLRLLVAQSLPAADPGPLSMLAAAATLVLLAGVLSAGLVLARLLGARSPHAVRDRMLRRRAEDTAFLPQRDPDARGRRRPRAPGAAPAAA